MDLQAELQRELAGDPASVALLEAFDESYEPPTYAGEMCERCGVRIARRNHHDEWHRNLSLNAYLTTGFVVSLLKEREE